MWHSWLCPKARQVSIMLSFWAWERFFRTLFFQIFLIPHLLVKFWWTIVWVAFNWFSIILTINRWSEPTRSWNLTTFSSVLAAKFMFHRVLALWECFKPPEYLDPWQNTVSIEWLQFWKSYCRSVPKSETKLDSLPLPEITVIHFQNSNSAEFKLILKAHQMLVWLHSKCEVTNVARLKDILPVIILFTHPVFLRNYYKIFF